MKRLHDKLQNNFSDTRVPLKVIRLTNPRVDENQVLSALLPYLKAQYQQMPMIFHLDVTASVSCLVLQRGSGSGKAS